MTPSIEQSSLPMVPFSQRWWLRLLRSGFWVLLVSVLIWVYADIEYTDQVELSATLQLNTGSSQTLMLLSPSEHVLGFELSGSKSSLKEFADELAENGSVLTYDVSQAHGPDDRFIPTRELLARAGDLRKRGIEVRSVSPEAIEVRLDTLVRIPDVPVDLETTGAELETPADPAKVSILVPKSLWDQLPARLQDQPRLGTRPQDLSALTPGKDVKVTAAVSPFLGEVRIQADPETVTYRVRVKSRTVTESLRVGVQVLSPASWAEPQNTTWSEYELVQQNPAEWTAELSVVGLRKDLKPENVHAYIELTDADKRPVESWLERDVTVQFMPGTNLRLASPAPKLKFRLQKRELLPIGP
jgi:hypothetical protein